jgi:two-component system LytT family response regulator
MSKILIVEDNAAMAKRLKQFIYNIDPSLELVIYAKAGEAYQFAEKETVSLFVIDIQLADYKGTNLARQLRSLPEYKYTPIIFETAVAGEELFAYRDLKCYGFLTKPFTEREFRSVFSEALGLSAQMRNPSKTIQIEQKQFILEYNINDIAYLESFGKKIAIHTSNKGLGIKEDMISGYTLAGIYALIDDPAFVQCHKSYIINKNYIIKIDKVNHQIALRGFEETVPVGNKYQTLLWG